MHFEATNHIVNVGLTIHTCAKNAQPLIIVPQYCKKNPKIEVNPITEKLLVKRKTFTKLKLKMHGVF